MRPIITLLLLTSVWPVSASEEKLRASLSLVMTTAERADLIHNRFLESRRERLKSFRDPYQVPPSAKVVDELPGQWEVVKSPWRPRVQATVFWVGEQPTPRNPTPNDASAWDPHWVHTFGGYDDPQDRRGYLPAGFSPRQSPFYIALPYNDIGPHGFHKEEAPDVIPWYWKEYRGPSISVCHERWVAIHYNKRVCYAQWRDVGPFRTNDWEYVFKGRRPQPNRNANAGIDVSPAVRDFLQMPGNVPVDWRFVEDYEVPQGPWSHWQGPMNGPGR